MSASKCPVCGATDDAEKCPVCGCHVVPGFGLMGGGYGPYKFCVSDDCDFFEKKQEAEEASP